MLVSLSGIIKFVDRRKKRDGGNYDALGEYVHPAQRT